MAFFSAIHLQPGQAPRAHPCGPPVPIAPGFKLRTPKPGKAGTSTRPRRLTQAPFPHRALRCKPRSPALPAFASPANSSSLALQFDCAWRRKWVGGASARHAPEVGGPPRAASQSSPPPPSRVAAEAGPGFVARSRWRRNHPAGSASAR